MWGPTERSVGPRIPVWKQRKSRYGVSLLYYDPEQYIRELLKLRERKANQINRMIKIAGFQLIKTL